MPSWKSDNIRRVLPRRRTQALLAAIAGIPSATAPWTDRDPDELDAWWRAVLADPRRQRSLEPSLPPDHPDAQLRLDRLAARTTLVTFQCFDCRHRGTFRTADLVAAFGPATNVNALGDTLFACIDKHARREGRFCQFRFEEGGYLNDVQHVRRG